MAATYLSLDKIKPNKHNPRSITEENLKKLKNSIEQSFEMLETNPLKLDENNMLLGGNMRLTVLKELGFTEAPVEWFTKDQAKRINERRKQLGLPTATYKALCAEFIIKDNVSYGVWDNVLLTANFGKFKLDDWGLVGFQQPEIDLTQFFEDHEGKPSGPKMYHYTLVYNEDDYGRLMELIEQLEEEGIDPHGWILEKITK